MTTYDPKAKRLLSESEEQRAKIDAWISDLATDLKPVVAKIESDKLPTTQNHYGRYLALFSQLSHGDARMGKLICSALIVAGANFAGVSAAYRIAFGDAPHAYGKR